MRLDDDDFAYREWIKERLGGLAGSYTMFIDRAFEVPFYEIVPNDENRAEDGKNLREEFFTETKVFPRIDSCTLLEMMVALAGRLNAEAYTFEDPDRNNYWFFVLLLNLAGNQNWEDQMMDPLTEQMMVRQMTKAVKREYKYDGSGGFFPLKSPREDQRRVEIWYQMMAWLDENQPEV
jgi:hypothetical protein